MAVTQKQIADRLSISRSLVQHALNGGTEVSASMRERILATAMEMGYDAASNRNARSLVARRYGQKLQNGTIAAASDITNGAELPFFVPIINGMQEEARSLGLEICVCPNTPGKLPALIRAQNVDGVVSMGYTPNLNKSVQDIGLPLVTLMARFDGIPAVEFDDYHGAYQATRHLLDLGHRRIAFLGVEHLPLQPAAARLRGYRDAMAEFGAGVRPEWVEISLDFPEATSSIYCRGCGRCAACVGWQTLLTKNGGIFNRENPAFTAIVCYNDSITMGVITQANAQDVEVPRDLSVTSFDDISHEYNFRPALTSVNLSLPEMGRQAVRLLHEMIQEADEVRNKPARYVTVPAQLSIRDSTRQWYDVNP